MAEKKGMVIVSSCLLGESVRYDGGHNRVYHRFLDFLAGRGCVISFCPEVAGGLATPRPPAEITGGDGYDVLSGRSAVVTAAGLDVTLHFIRGGRDALYCARKNNVRFALLKANSPSCGNRMIYDGSFSGKRVAGLGVTAALFESNGITVFNENEIDLLEMAYGKTG